jgi:hypothetical protein
MAPKIGELLLLKGWVTQAQLEDALQAQAFFKGRLGTNLVEVGAIDIDKLGQALAEQRGFPHATVQDFEAATTATLAAIPAPFAQEFRAFPLRREAGKLLIALASPFDRSQLEPIRSMAGVELVPYIAPELVLHYFLELRYRLKRPDRFSRWHPGAPPTTPPAPSRPPTTEQPVAAAGPAPSPEPAPALASKPVPDASADPLLEEPPATADSPALDPLTTTAPLVAPPAPSAGVPFFGTGDVFGSPPTPGAAMEGPTVRGLPGGEPYASFVSTSAGLEGPTAPLPPELANLLPPPEPGLGFPVVPEQPEKKEETLAPDSPRSEAAKPAEPALSPPSETAKRNTHDEMPAAVVQSEKQAGASIESERRKTDRETTLNGGQMQMFGPAPGTSLEGERGTGPMNTIPFGHRPVPLVHPPIAPVPTFPEAPRAPEGPLVEDDPAQPSNLRDEIAILPTAPQRSPGVPLHDSSRPGRPASGIRALEATPIMKQQSEEVRRTFLAPFGIGFGAAAVLFGLGLLIFGRAKPVEPPTPVAGECPSCSAPGLAVTPTPAQPEKVTVLRIDNAVDRLDLEGEWTPLAGGEVLQDGEQIRTGQGARARLVAGNASVDVGEYSRLLLRKATTEEHRFRLNSGLVAFQYAGSLVPFVLESRSGKAYAQGKADVTAFSDDVRFALSPRAGGADLVSVATGARLTIATGKLAVTGFDGVLPESTVELPEKLELALDPPRLVGRSLFLEGSLVGGPARVIIQGSPAPVDSENHFSTELKMPAKGPFVAMAVDVAGHRVSQEFAKTPKKAGNGTPQPKDKKPKNPPKNTK